MYFRVTVRDSTSS